jgi:CheY-like chemotaxis protein
VLDEAVALLARTVDKRCALRLVKGAERHAVVGDATLVQNVFINLGVNASHAMPDGGTLTFSTRNVALDEAHCAASRFALAPGLFLEVEVRDTGCGIQPEDLPRIFEPFFTTKGPGKGTGLGLSAVYGSVLDLHGSITVSSEPGRGSAFLVHLPVTEAAAAALATPSALVRGSGTVLIIDDEEVVRTTAQALLARLGYQVLVAEDGAAGLQLFERRRPEVEVVLLDMTMPGLSGRETFRRLRQLDPSARIVVCSAFSKEGELEQLQAQGLTGFLRKPFRLAELSLALDEARRAPARA